MTEGLYVCYNRKQGEGRKEQFLWLIHSVSLLNYHCGVCKGNELQGCEAWEMVGCSLELDSLTSITSLYIFIEENVLQLITLQMNKSNFYFRVAIIIILY